MAGEAAGKGHLSGQWWAKSTGVIQWFPNQASAGQAEADDKSLH